MFECIKRENQGGKKGENRCKIFLCADEEYPYVRRRKMNRRRKKWKKCRRQGKNKRQRMRTIRTWRIRGKKGK